MPWEPLAEYLAGLVGCTSTLEDRAEFDAWVSSQGLYPYAADAIASGGLEGSGAGKLTALWLYMEKLFPGCLPGAAQSRGDCVSHSSRTAAVCTMCAEIIAGRPDEVTGEIEDKPEMPVEGYKDVICSSEAVYWYRRHNGDGWHCGASAKVICEESGLWPRKNYEEFGFDLTKYNGRLAGKWGSPVPPDNITAHGRKHLMRTATRCTTWEQVRDLLANGFALTTCGGEGWSSSRDENGVSRRQGGWAHALSVLGADDRDIIKQKYGEPLVMVQNSWNKWNGGGRRVLGTDIDIPEGAFWSKWSDFKNREMIAFSGFNGWPAQKLPNWTTGIF
jgi:hypothetical protein